MATIKLIYNRRNKLSKSGDAPVEFRVTHERRPYYFATGIHVFPEQWNSKVFQVNSKHPDSFLINEYLSQKIQTINSYFFECIKKNSSINIDVVGQKLRTKAGNSRNTFIEFIKDVSKNSTTVAISTKRHYDTEIRRIEEWKERIDFDDIDLRLINEYHGFLLKQNLKTNSIWNSHKTLRKFINAAIQQGHITNNPYQHFKIPKEEVNREVLTLKQVIDVFKLRNDENILDTGYNVICDMFVWSCLTGLRISDAINLKNGNFTTENDQVYMTFRMIKTVSVIKNFPIFKVAKVLDGHEMIETIFKAYYSYHAKDDSFFPKYTDQHINRSLKTIAKLANIDIPLTFHVARHTFGSLLAERTGNVILIKELMGHTKIDTSMIYIHMSKKRIEDTLDRYL